MTADVRTFKAETMQAALDVVRREMGGDAVILHTRQIEKRRIWPWSRAQAEVEITAGIGVKTRATPTSKSSVVNEPPAPVTASVAVETLAPPPDLLPTSRGRKNNVTPPKWSPSDVIADEPRTVRPKPFKSAPVVQPPTPTPVPATTAPMTVAARARLRATEPAPAPSSQLEANTPTLDKSLDLEHRLELLQKMILDLGRERRNDNRPEIAAEHFGLFTTLIEAEVETEIARDLVGRIKTSLRPGLTRDSQAAMSCLTGLIERELRIAPPITPVRGRRKVVALVGPTGVGKTTTLAKLAGNFRLREGAKLGLVTVDTYRIAAVDQLRTYAEIIDLPMRVVTTPDDMRKALLDLQGLDLVLIDTAGRSPNDEPRIQELQTFLAAAQVDEVHLVLSLTSGLKAAESAWRSFQPVGVTSLVLTKLDEATGAGQLLNFARRLSTPVSYLTTGQDVPDDFEPAQTSRIARLILGHDRLD